MTQAQTRNYIRPLCQKSYFRNAWETLASQLARRPDSFVGAYPEKDQKLQKGPHTIYRVKKSLQQRSRCSLKHYQAFFTRLPLLPSSLVCERGTLIHATRKRTSFISSPSKRSEMPVLKISPPSQPERVIRKEKERFAFRQPQTCKNLCDRKGELTPTYFFRFNKEFFSQGDREKKTEAVSQIETGSNRGHMQNQVVCWACEMGRLAGSKHLLQLLFIEL